ncbi:MAG TPA: LysM peptidoglycan-binding domain-containing protein [Candidatus Sulfomarinibacteraceae bacterium]|nr:LysM peptidoglycan-binding domain-containing protein [Candidatus Sulfomarinibacteraceae bacterium]
MKSTRLIVLLIIIVSGLLGLHVTVGLAQDGEGTAPAQEGNETPEPTPSAPTPDDGVPRVHVVQEGENLTSIAALYDITVQELMVVNGLSEDDIIFPGQRLTIPGAEGDVVAATYTVQVGDTLASIAAMFNTSAAEIAETNRLVSPDALYAGQILSVVSRTGAAEPRPLTGTLHYVQPGDTMLSVAARHGLTPQTIAELNELPPPARLYPGMRLRLPHHDDYQFLPGSWQKIRLRTASVRQGQTVSIYVENDQPGTPQGEFARQSLQFAPYAEGYVALAGVDAFTEPGRYRLQLSGAGDEEWWPFTQAVQVVSSNFPTQTVNVPEELVPLLAPEVRTEEDAFLSTIYGQFTPEPYWDGLFQTPVTNTVVTAPYGGIRSYNGGPFDIFHTGVDYGGTTGTPILAPAPGQVVYTGTLELRGQTVIIDHGLGVHSGYYHLSEIEVQVGDIVDTGQIIGRGGSTGLSTGPHLHWELRVLDVPVDGVQWTEEPFP